jgi:DNA-binding MarR family transcriptional regulator
MKIPLKTSNKRFYRQVLEVLRSFPPINKLRPKELDLLAEFMKQNAELSFLSKNKRRAILFSTENRRQIQENLNMTQATFNNNLSGLRRYKLVTKENDLIPLLDIKDINELEDDFSIEIKFYVTNSE